MDRKLKLEDFLPLVMLALGLWQIASANGDKVFGGFLVGYAINFNRSERNG